LWEIEFNYEVNSLRVLSIGNNGGTIFAYGEGVGHYYLITKSGAYYKLPEGWNSTRDVLFLEGNSMVYKRSKVSLFQILLNGTIKLTDFNGSVIVPQSSGKVTTQSSHLGVEKIDDNKFICWDFTPPTLASTDNEGGNNGGNTAMSRLSIGTSGPDISIATDGKLGGPAVLQKSNDLKNWRKLSDVPANSADLLITPRDGGSEFFRLKRVGE
jgi:hypothetical protein